jgi:hypothetical protein
MDYAAFSVESSRDVAFITPKFSVSIEEIVELNLYILSWSSWLIIYIYIYIKNKRSICIVYYILLQFMFNMVKVTFILTGFVHTISTFCNKFQRISSFYIN